MPRAVSPATLGFALAGAMLLSHALLQAQTCQSPRPTDAGGSQGLAYGSAEVAFLDAPSGRARVHYALSGVHAPPAASTRADGVPDVIAVAAQAADDALDEYTALGYAPPLGDGDSPCGSNGDSDALDIYIVNFAAADGQAVPDHCETGSPRRCAGFVLVENDFRAGGYANAAEGMRTVVPHELFHLVQNAYDADVEPWWAEGSAQWAAKQVYPELRDLERFLPGYFDNPWRPLNVPPSGPINSFLYATAIWPVFLHERFDADVVREIYEGFETGAGGALETADVVLQARGSSLAAEFLQFAAYNAATGERATDEAGYLAAADYPLVPLTPFAVEPGAALPENSSGFGAFYYSVATTSPLELGFESDPTRVAALLMPLVEGKARLDQAQPLPATLEGEGIVVVAGQTLDRKNAPFTLTASAQAAPKTDDEVESSGCSFRPTRPWGPANPSALAGIMVSLFGLLRVVARGRAARKVGAMRPMRGPALLLVSTWLLGLGCSSQPIDAGDASGGSSSGGSNAGGGSKGQAGTPPENPCSSALRQQLSLVDSVATATVSVLESNGAELVLYVDATAGGIDGQDKNPWVYVSLATGDVVGLTDLEALTSFDWDLGFKRFVIRTNGGDSGPGQGGAFRVALAWDDVDASTLGTRMPLVEDWFDDDCNLTVDADTNELITTFSGWSEYDQATHVLAPADAVYLTRGADGTLYKVAILDYYSTPTGGAGTIPGRYKLRVAPLP